MNMSGYELRRHLASSHGIEVSGLAFAELTDIHAGEHWPDPSHPKPDHSHDGGDAGEVGHAGGSSMAHPSHGPAGEVT